MERVITDKAGRRITLRKFGVLEMLRLFKAVGPELSVNRPYMGAAIVASSVAMIDDVPVPVPVNEAGVEAVMERLGDDGVAAVSAAIKKPPVEQLVAAAGN
jgi:predicted metalloprotease with PDZ domain